jgi:asparagine synthase (glutamine-hydrolysing)
MGAALRHRGPDDEGVWVNGDCSPAAGLAHRRLSIIDVSSAGHQPMTNEDETVWITYNGEIYNHTALRRDLERAGHVYHSHTDTETVVHAYEEWGDSFMERFDGMFAFGLWDSRRRRLVLVRDRLGIKPLYYAPLSGKGIVFASEIKALFAGGQVTAEAADEALPEYLLFGYLSGESTLFKGVYALPPGHMLVWDDSGVRTTAYWDVSFKPDTTASPDELRRTFEELFDTAVHSHLMSDVPLGVFLSGGLDSSAIAAVMARHMSGRLKTFSIGFPEGCYSELPYARAVAQHLDAEHHEIVLTSREFLCSLPRMVWYEDEPIWTIASVAMYHVARLASDHVKVVLTGEGSDELFAGYDRYWCGALNDRMAAPYARVPAALRAAVRAGLGHTVLPERLRRALSHTFLCRDLTVEALIFDNWFGIFTPEMQRGLCSDRLCRQLSTADIYAAHLKPYQSSGSDDIVDRMLYVDVKTNLVELLMKQDRMTMATSLESRVPFLDHRLVEFAGAIPPEANLGHFSGKRLLKKAVEGLLPPAIVSRRKQGFPVPFDAWLQQDFFSPVSRLLLSERALSRRWFQPDSLKTLLDAHSAGRQNFSRQVWTLLTLELWARVFLDNDRLWVEDPADAWQLRPTTGARNAHINQAGVLIQNP